MPPDQHQPVSLNQKKRKNLKPSYMFHMFIIGGLYFLFQWYQFAKQMRYFSRNLQQREVCLLTESAWYYSFYKDFITAPSYLAGMNVFTNNTSSEAPDQINALERFNVYQELFVGFLYRLLFGDFNTNSNMDPMSFYMNFLFAVGAVGFSAFFMVAAKLNDSMLSGYCAVLFYFLNWFEASRVWHLPPLRECWAIPILFIQQYCILNLLRQNKKELRIYGLYVFLSILFMILWQFSTFIMFIETSIVVGLNQFGYMKNSTARRLAGCNLIILTMTSLLQLGGTQSLLFLSPFSLTSISLIVVLNFIDDHHTTKNQKPGVTEKLNAHSKAIPSSTVLILKRLTFPFSILKKKISIFLDERWSVLASMSRIILIFILMVFLKVYFILVHDFKDDSHIFSVLKVRLGLTTGKADFDTALYTEATGAFQPLSIDYYINLTKSLVLPLAIFSFGTIVYSFLKDLGRERSQRLVQPEHLYIVAMTFAFFLMAACMMRFLSLVTPFACLIASLQFQKLLALKNWIWSKTTVFSSKVIKRIGKWNQLVFIGILLSIIIPWKVDTWSLSSLRGQVIWRINHHQGRDSYREELYELVDWMTKYTDPSSIVSSDMATASSIRLSTSRSITSHPQYESVKIRNRTKLIAQVFGKRLVKDVHNIMLELETDLLVVNRILSFHKPSKGRSFSKIVEDEVVSKLPNITLSSWSFHNMIDVMIHGGNPYFEVPFHNGRYAVLRVLPKEFHNVSQSFFQLATKYDEKPKYFCGYAKYLDQYHGNKKDALEWYAKAISSGTLKIHFDCFHQYALLNEDAGNLQIAEKYYKKTLELAPNASEVLANYALFLDEKKNDPKAEHYFLQSLHHDKTDTKVFVNYAYFLIERNRFKEAQEWLDRALQLTPQSSFCLCVYAIYHLKQQNLSSAKLMWKKARDINPRESCVLQLKATLEFSSSSPLDYN